MGTSLTTLPRGGYAWCVGKFWGGICFQRMPPFAGTGAGLLLNPRGLTTQKFRKLQSIKHSKNTRNGNNKMGTSVTLKVFRKEQGSFQSQHKIAT